MGHEVCILLPKYQHIDVSTFEKLPSPIGVRLGSGTAWCAIYQGYLPGSAVRVYLLEHDAAYGKPFIYGDEGGTLWGGFKFGLLSLAAFEFTRWLGWKPDIVHVHDWPTAWVPVIANSREQVYAESIAHVLTIHNMAHQPKFPPDVLELLGVGRAYFREDGFEDFGQVNPFKAGLYHATMLTTVSPRYAHEIRSPALGGGLDRVAEFRAGDLVGILNGIDDNVWDPSRDIHIPARYSVHDLSGKSVCKAKLEAEMGLDSEPNGPLIGLISRLTWQKGLDIVSRTLERILATGARAILLGSGEPWLENQFRQHAERYRGRFAAQIGFSESLSHLIEAGCDLYLMPSRFEPCGLNQLYSQRYGTLPIVHATGGLEDTVEQCDHRAGTGTGFKMYSLHEESLVNTVRWAVNVYRKEPQLYRAMQEQSMKKDMGWDVAARNYVDVYRWALERKGLSPSRRDEAKG